MYYCIGNKTLYIYIYIYIYTYRQHKQKPIHKLQTPIHIYYHNYNYYNHNNNIFVNVANFKINKITFPKTIQRLTARYQTKIYKTWHFHYFPNIVLHKLQIIAKKFQTWTIFIGKPELRKPEHILTIFWFKIQCIRYL